jgi:L-aspartate oxidase
MNRKTHILVIGSGLSGAIAALTAAAENKKVILITKSEDLLSGNTPWAQGGIVYANSNDKNLAQDIVSAGSEHSWMPAVEQISSKGAKLVEDLLINKYKVPFERDNNNQLIYTSEAAHSAKQIIHCKDLTGKIIQKNIINEVLKNNNITILTNHTAIDLLTYSHHSVVSQDIYKKPACFGAVVLNNINSKIINILSDKTILATGGLGQLYLHTTNPLESQGDGLAMAWRSGARCFNLQYIQFHPTAMFHESSRFLISEAMRGEGGKLYDINGKEFMNNIHPLSNLAPRDIVARGIHDTLINTQHPCVYLDISHKPPMWIKKRFPTIFEKCNNLGIDITKKAIPVVPAAHYSCGGVGVNLLGRTSLKRLYAIGEVSCTGVHGANRLASTSLLECLVWGYLAGKNAATFDEDHHSPEINPWNNEEKIIDLGLIAQDWLTIKNTMWNYVGLVRTRDRLNRAQNILRNLQYDIEQFYQKAQITPAIIGLRNGIQSAVAITNAALEDRNSKGCHYIKQ